MEIINNITGGLQETLKKFSGRQKLIMGLAAAGLVVGITVLILYITTPEYVTLYKDLDLTVAADVTTNLDSLNIPYKIDGNGTISVPSKDINRARLNLASAGLPDAKFDYSDLLERNSMFSSSEERAQARNYAHQNEIANAIELIPGVEKAVVNLVIPNNTDFILQENRETPKASVILVLQGNANLDEKSIDGITRLVASSVEGLTPENVTVHGPNGQVINRPATSDASYTSSTNLELQGRVKKDIEESLNNFLAPIYGYGNVSVMVSVKLNFDSDVTQTKIFSAPIEGETEGMVRSLQENTETVENRQGAVGNPGVNANEGEAQTVVDYATVDDNGGNSNYDKNEKIVNYELNEIVKNVEKAKGQIESLTVAAVINKDILEGGELTEDMKSEFTTYITAATGLDTKAVEVYAQSFNKDMLNSMTATGETSGLPLWNWIVFGVIAAIPLLLLAFATLRNRKKKDEFVASEAALATEGGIGDISRLEQEQSIEFEIKESGRKKSIENLIDKNPEIVTQLLKSWLDED